MDHAAYQRHQQLAMVQLTPLAWQAAWAEGQAMLVEQIVEYALGDVTR
jgi:hypothetical protein